MNEIKEGQLIEYKEHGVIHYGEVKKDDSFYGGLKCNGRSIHNIFNDSEYVKVIK